MSTIEVKCSKCADYVTMDHDYNDPYELQPGTNDFWTWSEMFICEDCFNNEEIRQIDTESIV